MTVAHGLPADALLAAVSEHFGVAATAIEPRSGGQDHNAWLYQLSAGPSPDHILKVRRTAASTDPVARVVSSLRDLGVPFVVAPVPSVRGEPTVEIRGFSLSLYPFIKGRTGVDAGLTDGQWRRLGGFVRTLHETRLPEPLMAALPRERFRPREIALARRVDRAVEGGTFADPVAREIAAFWAGHRREILDLVDRTEVLGRAVRRRRPPMVVTHGDLHTWNILVDPDGEPWVIDWDEVGLAPVERDLMFFVGGISAELVSPRATSSFLGGYGDPTIDEPLLSYFRHAWATQDIASYAARVLVDASVDPAGRAEAASIFLGLFRPGEILDLAVSSG